MITAFIEAQQGKTVNAAPSGWKIGYNVAIEKPATGPSTGSGLLPGGTTSVEKPAKSDKTDTSVPAPGDGLGTRGFSDIASHWAASAIKFVVERKLFNGVSDTEFSPNSPMTRAMFATVVSRYANGIAAGSVRFVDVLPEKWYTNGVLWAAENGITSGIGDGRFDPDAPITREQLAVMLHNYAKFAGFDLSAAGAWEFADADSISSWAKDALSWAVGTGILTGKPGNLIDAKGFATRAEVATVLQRFIEKSEAAADDAVSEGTADAA
jgi:hypothetical protein